MVSSTTPRLGPRWPPRGAQVRISSSRISEASSVERAVVEVPQVLRTRDVLEMTHRLAAPSRFREWPGPETGKI